MSGTSMAAPIVAGVAALYLERNPDTKPRDVKQQLAATAHALAGVPATDQGAGVIDALAALTVPATAAAYTRYPASRAFADQMYQSLKGKPFTWRDLSFHGGVDSRGATWASVTWDSITWDAITWENLIWEAFAWDAVTWEAITWDTASWVAITWEAVTWETTPSNGWTAVY
jgi:subtilisin family serine protease